jgi:hypothetical protein
VSNLQNTSTAVHYNTGSVHICNVCMLSTSNRIAAAAPPVVLSKPQAITEVKTNLRSVVNAVSEREESIRCKCNSLKFFHESSFLFSTDWLRWLLKVDIKARPLCLCDVTLNVAHTCIHSVLALAASLMCVHAVYQDIVNSRCQFSSSTAAIEQVFTTVFL